MKLVNPDFEILFKEDKQSIYKRLEQIGRVCYKSEDKITEDSAATFVKGIMRRRHYAILEHYSISVRWITTRGMTHALVRHRIGAFAQESTIYCDYAKGKFGSEIAIIDPSYIGNEDAEEVIKWTAEKAEEAYMDLRRHYELSPGLARAVLPTDLKTELITTFNLRMWIHFFEMRADKVDHLLTYQLTGKCLQAFQEWMPEIFSGIVPYSLQGKA